MLPLPPGGLERRLLPGRRGGARRRRELEEGVRPDVPRAGARHLRFLAEHRGMKEAERARLLFLAGLHLRAGSSQEPAGDVPAGGGLAFIELGGGALQSGPVTAGQDGRASARPRSGGSSRTFLPPWRSMWRRGSSLLPSCARWAGSGLLADRLYQRLAAGAPLTGTRLKTHALRSRGTPGTSRRCSMAPPIRPSCGSEPSQVRSRPSNRSPRGRRLLLSMPTKTASTSKA